MQVYSDALTASERDTVFGFERQSRARMLLVCGASFAASFLFAALALIVWLIRNGVQHHAPLVAVAPILSLMALCCAIGARRARQGRIGWAAIYVGGSGTVGTALFHALWIYYQGIDAISLLSFGAYPALITFAALLSTRRIVFVEVLATNLITLGLFLLMATTGHLVPAILIVPLSQQWGVVVTIIASGYFRVQRQLGLERVANERARKLDDIKNQFISNVNHELRTPAMAIMGLLDLAALEIAMPSQRRQRLIHSARDASLDLVELLQSILEIQQIEQGAETANSEPVNVLREVKAAAELVSPREANATERVLRLAIAAHLTVWGNHIRLRQVLTNLLSNAVKYSSVGQPIEVAAQIVSRLASPQHDATLAGPMVLLTVRDYGLGIPPEEAPLLFQRFVRLPRDIASTVIGNGLGLYLCRTYITAMGGAIWLESTGVDGEGTTFFVALPLFVEETA